MYLFLPLQEQAQANPFSGIIMIVLLIVVFWLFMIRPQQKRQKEIRKQREAMTKGDKVVTAGGIYGVINSVKEKTFVIEIANGVHITVDKNSVYASSADANVDQQAAK